MLSKQPKHFIRISIVLFSMLLLLIHPTEINGSIKSESLDHSKKQSNIQPFNMHQPLKLFVVDSGYHFDYQDAVRGIYDNSKTAGDDRFRQLLDLVENSDLNAIVIDIKEDYGHLTFVPDPSSPYTGI